MSTVPNSCRVFRPPPVLVLFDLDDTLCDYARAREARLRCAFTLHLGSNEREAFEIVLPEMVAASIALSPHGVEHFPELFARFGITDPNVATAAAHWYKSNRFHALSLFPEAVATLRALRTVYVPGRTPMERRIGIITNGPAQVQRDKVTLLELPHLVDFIIVSGEFGVEKPDRRIFDEALRLGKAVASEAVFIGDSLDYDILGANKAGIRSIWVNRTGATWSEPEHRPTCEVADISTLLPILGSIPD